VRRVRSWTATPSSPATASSSYATKLRDDPRFLEPLRGFVLACWCPVELGVRCHADIILEWFEMHPAQPQPGERPVLGVHRQVEADAETAPAWPSFGSIDSHRSSAYRRFLKGGNA